jgi:serine/threonine-protein kinase RsbT
LNEVVVAVQCDADIVAARQKGREMAADCGFSTTQQTMLATAISELARNILSYAGAGQVRLQVLNQRGRVGVQVVAEDRGPGISDPELALKDGYSTSKSLGLGLPGARRIVDEFTLDTQVGVGTTVRLVKWL